MMMILSVLTQPNMEEEILQTPMGTHGLKTRMTETIMVEEEALDSKEIPLNTSKEIEAKPWTSWSPSKGS
jgi:hypothetical protein